jgi:WD40 repeat protein
MDGAAVSDAYRLYGAPIWRRCRRMLTIALSPDGARLATGANPSELALWSAADGTLQTQFSRGDGALVSRVAFTPDGQKLIATAVFGFGSPTIFDLTGGVVQAWPEQNQGGYYFCLSAALSPDGTHMAASCDPFLKVWTADGTLVAQRRFDYAID